DLPGASISHRPNLIFLSFLSARLVRWGRQPANTLVGCGGGVPPMGDGSDIDTLLDEVAQGRTESFGQIVRAFALPLRSYLASHVHHNDDVDALAQEVFLAALESLPTFRRGDDFGAWLRGIARNKLLTYFRSTARRTRAMQRFHESVAKVIEL